MENGTAANSTAHPAGLLWNYQTLVACPAPSCQVALVRLFDDSVFLLFLASPQCLSHYEQEENNELAFYSRPRGADAGVRSVSVK